MNRGEKQEFSCLSVLLGRVEVGRMGRYVWLCWVSGR